MKLYFFPRTRSVRPRWLLEEIGASYELLHVDLRKGEHKRPEYREVHPLGSVPALVDGPTRLFDSTAICLYLAEGFPDRGLCPNPRERGDFYQWIFFAMTTLEPLIDPVYLRSFRVAPAERLGTATDAEREALATPLGPLSDHLKDRDFVTTAFSAADVIVGGVLHWAEEVGMLRDHPSLAEYVHRLRARPAFQRANGQ